MKTGEQSKRVVRVPEAEWRPAAVGEAIRFPNVRWLTNNNERFEVWRSQRFLVQLFHENGMIRMTVNRCQRGENRWEENITWDELQELKSDVGYGDHCAVELFPRECDVVNVANMRHLWIYPEGAQPPFVWTKR